MKNNSILVGLIFSCIACKELPKKELVKPETSGNPIFEGWYADPEGAVLNNEYWVYPTYSDDYDKQLFFDAFSSKDLVTWQKHGRILDTTIIKWCR